MDKNGIVLLMAAMVIAVLIGGVHADPDVYYYGDCTVPTDEHFLSFLTGIQDYRVNTIDIVHGSAPLINTYSGISERQNSYKLGMSKNEQEKLALLTAGRESGNALWCYTLPDPVQEARFGPVQEIEVQDPNKGYFTNDDGSITLDGLTYRKEGSVNGGTSYAFR